MKICSKLLLSLFILIFSLDVEAQGDVVVMYPPDLDATQVDSFFSTFTINLGRCENPDLYFEIFRWYKTCYRYGGSGDKGIDCSGFTSMIYDKIFGRKIPHSSSGIFEVCTALPKDELPVEGDFVFFKIRKGRISHVGIYLQHNKFAHASTQSGVIISDLDEPYYKKYFYRAGRLKGQ
jgi:lipoprotein Spr